MASRTTVNLKNRTVDFIACWPGPFTEALAAAAAQNLLLLWKGKLGSATSMNRGSWSADWLRQGAASPDIVPVACQREHWPEHQKKCSMFRPTPVTRCSETSRGGTPSQWVGWSPARGSHAGGSGDWILLLRVTREVHVDRKCQANGGPTPPVRETIRVLPFDTKLSLNTAPPTRAAPRSPPAAAIRTAPPPHLDPTGCPRGVRMHEGACSTSRSAAADRTSAARAASASAASCASRSCAARAFSASAAG